MTTDAAADAADAAPSAWLRIARAPPSPAMLLALVVAAITRPAVSDAFVELGMAEPVAGIARHAPCAMRHRLMTIAADAKAFYFTPCQYDD